MNPVATATIFGQRTFNVLVSIMLCLCFVMPGQAANPSVSGPARKLNQDTDRLVQVLQVFLQANNRWLPKPVGQDMQACFAMQDLKQQVEQFSKRGSSLNEGDLTRSIDQIQQTSRGLGQILKSIGSDQIVLNQYRIVKNDIRSLTSLAHSNYNDTPSAWRPSPGYNQPSSNPFGLQILSSKTIGPNLMSVTWRGPSGNQTYVSQVGSYKLSDGIHTRDAIGQEVQILNHAYSGGGASVLGATGNGSNFVNPGFNQNTGFFDINSNGKGQLYFLNVAAMDIKSVSLRSMASNGGRTDRGGRGNWGGRGRHRGTGGDGNGSASNVEIVLTAKSGQTVQFEGSLVGQSAYRLSVRVLKSQNENASGNMFIDLGAGGKISAVNGNGSIGGKPFSVKFNG